MFLRTGDINPIATIHVETIVSIQRKNSQKFFILGTLRSISCSLRRVKKSEISTSKTTLMFQWQLISGVGTQTENKGFPQSTCLCSVHPADKIQATGSQKLNGISVSLEIVVRLFFAPICIFEYSAVCLYNESKKGRWHL